VEGLVQLEFELKSDPRIVAEHAGFSLLVGIEKRRIIMLIDCPECQGNAQTKL
jgi:hypothetical protein